MQVIFDNIVFSLQRCGGISMVWANLVSRVLAKMNGVSFIEYQNSNDNICRQNLDLGNNVASEKMFCIKLGRFLNPHISVKGSEKFIFHSSYYRTCSNRNAINVTTVHDFAYRKFVKNPLIRYIQCRQQDEAVRKSDAVVCISENTKRDLLYYLPDVNPEKISVIYNGVDNRFSYMRSAEKKDYVLYVGKRDRYKNFNTLIEPLAKLGYKLKIVGVPLSSTEIQLLDKARLKYEYCGIVSDTELNKLYNEAICLLYTSLYEGFGLPILEAQMAGCPVIAFNSSSIPEVIGDKELLLDDITVDTLRMKMEYVKNNRDQIVRDGLENVKRFSWDKMADEYMDLYKKLLNR